MSNPWNRLVAVLAAMALVLAACGDADDDAADPGDDPTETTAPANGAPATGDLGFGDVDCADDEVLCVGLVTDIGQIDDRSFNQSAWEGVLQAQQELDDIYIDFIQTVDPTDYAVNIGTLVDQGVDVIVTVGFGLGEATIEAAQENPEINFIGVDQFQGEPADNVAGLIFPEDQAGFMAGALAGLLTETNIVGAVLGTDIVPPVVLFKEGWENGARHTNPDVQLISTFHPGGLEIAFSDPAWGADTARQAMDQGADVIFGAGGETGNGALAAIAGAGGEVWCVGVDTDQWETVPEARDCLVTSAMKLITPGVADLIRLHAEGQFPGDNFVGEVGLAPYHDHEDAIPDEVRAEVDRIVEGVRAGEIDTGV
jgi:basic membrane protein A and related proteins